MRHEQTPETSEIAVVDYIDRLALRVFCPAGSDQPTTNSGDLVDFYRKYPDCRIEFVDLLETDGQSRPYAVVLPKSAEES